MVATFVRCFVLCAVACSLYAEELEWRRNIAMGEVPSVKEKIQYVKSDKVREITMFADSNELNGTPYAKSISLHDYKAKNEFSNNSFGLVALKVDSMHACFIMDISKSFDDVITDAEERAKAENPVELKTPEKYYKMVDNTKIKNLKTMSPRIDEFCNKLRRIRIEETPARPGHDGGYKYFAGPLHVLCYWAEIPIEVVWFFMWTPFWY